MCADRHTDPFIPAIRRNGSRSSDALAAELMTDALVVRAEADLRWLEMCEARLLQQPSTETRRS